MSKNILIFAPYGDWRINHQVDALIGHSLKLRGCKVLSLICDNFFENCQISKNKTKCSKCKNMGLELFSTIFNVKCLPLNTLITYQDKIDCRNWSESINPVLFNDAVFENNQIGKWILCGMHSTFNTGILDYSSNYTINAHRSYLYSGALLTRVFKNLLKN